MTDLADCITTRDGVRLALIRVGNGRGAPVVLTHGTFSNHRSCMALAAFLAARGLACWVFDWRGHGRSAQPRAPYTFDTVAMEDVPAVIDAVRARSAGQRIFWVGHSGGGLVAAMWMARNPAHAARALSGVVLLASQATAAAVSWRNRLRVRAMACWIACGGRLPGPLLGVGPESEAGGVMRQWCQWNLRGAFVGIDTFDYMRALRSVEVPVLALAGVGDTFIAPEQGCEALASAFGSADRTFRLCGRLHGFREDYTHERLILSRNAARETWPLIEHWLATHGAAMAQGALAG
ncbi:lysophospholipase [Trinickia sp. LjRoot230]|uniref:alpha/beta fold hydrolase n=1 Tax=Trinickia sp. LjRoot230 TaxID=3342288 RepID=UPI003ECC30EE